MSIALSLVSISLVIFIAFGLIPYQLIYPSLIVNAIMLAYGVKKLGRITKGMDKAHYMVHTYASAIKILEESNFSSNKIRDLQSKLRSNHVSATLSVAQLAKLMYRLEARTNMLYAILDVPLLLDNHLLLDVLSWKESHQNDLSNWLDVIHEMECLSSIAGFSYANPSYSFPSISGEFNFSGTEIGHPLISAKEKVRNNYSIQGKGSVDVITGSNMSGKSTFERTIGINMVLAQAGCPVDAKSLTMCPTQVFTSMRTKDNLEERTSSFYAELKRLAQLLDKIENQESTFFILDEILKGTNSQDRHSGSVALIKTLSHRKSFGIISTHDLELGSLSRSQDEVRNFSFNSTLDGDKIIFDYLLTEGICKSFNATQLMKNMGIF
jgi:DNA mismatch repair ATPase MutS